MNQFFFLKYFSIILLLLAVFSKMHSAPMEDSLALRTQFSKNIRAAGDTAVRIQKKTLDSLSHILEASFHRQRVSLKTLKDSLLTSTDKVLDPKRIESITKLHIRFSENLNSYSQSRQRLMRERLQIYQHTIQDLVDAHSLCRSCKESDDFENALNTFQEKVNHSTDIFFDAASDEYENTSNALADTADILRDSLPGDCRQKCNHQCAGRDPPYAPSPSHGQSAPVSHRQFASEADTGEREAQKC